MVSMNWGEARFYLLLTEVLAGSRSPDELLEDAEFLIRAKKICRLITSGPECEPMDLFQDSCLKLWTFFSRRDDEPGEGVFFADGNAFFSWYLVLARNLRTDYFRKNGRRQEQEVSLDENIAAALAVAAPGVGPEGDCLLEEFAGSLECLPEGRRRAVTLRQEGYSYEEIARQLNADGIRCTKVTARTWVLDALDNFFEGGHRTSVKKVAGL